MGRDRSVVQQISPPRPTQTRLSQTRLRPYFPECQPELAHGAVGLVRDEPDDTIMRVAAERQASPLRRYEGVWGVERGE